MSGMMDCSERRGHWRGQGGIQQGAQKVREDPRGSPFHMDRLCQVWSCS